MNLSMQANLFVQGLILFKVEYIWVVFDTKLELQHCSSTTSKWVHIVIQTRSV